MDESRQPESVVPPPGAAEPPTIPDMVAEWAGATPDAPAIGSTDGAFTSYAALTAQVEATARQLASFGLGRDARVASVLPDGPTAAGAFIAVASAAAYMPLDTSYGPADLEYRFRRAAVNALLLPSEAGSSVRATAEGMGISVLEVTPGEASSPGTFSLSGDHRAQAAGARAPGPDDIALLAFTSGTTSRPKLVPLAHANLCAGARNVASWFGLRADDRCLNVMPLCHLHAQVRGLLAPLCAGGCVICAPGPDSAAFLGWVRDLGVTYYSASPAIHRQVVRRAAAEPGALRDCRLRMIGSSSAPLEPEVIDELERVFRATVVDSYGLTETASQVVGTPRRREERKPGSVGIAAGAEVAIVNGRGQHLGPGSRGEIIVRGPGVISSYGDPVDNEDAFFGDWLRTGDEGYLDEDGFLFLTGRIKEIINRGGEKVSPAEVERALLSHPAVDEAAAFPLPDERLGESVAAAVVLKEDGAAGEADLIRFAASRLAHFKVPSHVFLCPQLPRAPSGKLRRSELSEQFAPVAAGAPDDRLIGELTNPLDPVETVIARMWNEVLGPDLEIGRASSFFDLGGDSMAAARLLARVEMAFGTEYPAALFYRMPTVGGMAWYLAERSTDWGGETLVGLQTGGTRLPLFFCTAGPAWFLMPLARHLGPDQPFYALQALGMIDSENPRLDVCAMAAAYVACIRDAQPEGPYQITGLSAGGTIALEVAHQLLAQGQAVRLLAVMDALAGPALIAPFGGLARLLERQRKRIREFAQLPPSGKVAAIRRGAEWLWDTPRRRAARREDGASVSRYVRNIHRAILPLIDAHRRATARYEFRPYPGRIIYYWCEDTWFLALRDPRLGWRDLARGGFVIHKVPGYHFEVLEEPCVEVLARKLTPYLDGRRT